MEMALRIEHTLQSSNALKITVADIERLRDNPFRLLMVAKKALYAAHWPKSRIKAFAQGAGQDDITNYPTSETPRRVKDRLVHAVEGLLL